MNKKKEEEEVFKKIQLNNKNKEEESNNKKNNQNNQGNNSKANQGNKVKTNQGNNSKANQGNKVKTNEGNNQGNNNKANQGNKVKTNEGNNQGNNNKANQGNQMNKANKKGRLVSWSNKSLAMNTTILSNNKANLFHVQMWRKTKWGNIIKQPGTEVGKRFGIGHSKHKQVKIPTLLKLLMQNKKSGKQILYSRYIRGLTAALGKAGWIQYQARMMNKPLPSEGNGFIVIPNVVTKRQRKLLMKGFNKSKNDKGKYINLVLVHSGIDLIAPRCTKTVHIFEPKTTSDEKRRIIKRGVRRCPGLSKHKFHNMKVYTYFSLKKGDAEIKNGNYNPLKKSKKKKGKGMFSFF